MVDYTYLRQSLSLQKWEVAEEETEKLMRDIMGKPYDGPQLFIQEFNNFPCKELKMLDDLWLESSNYHFGFGIQASIYEKNNRDEEDFYKVVGWKIGDKYRHYTELIYSLSAPKGHLPFIKPPSDRLFLVFRTLECYFK